MITAVDTNIILDILIPDEPFSGSSKRLLDQHLSKGKLILCEVVLAELASHFPSEEELKLFLADTGMGLVHSNERSLYVAGMRWAQYAGKGSSVPTEGPARRRSRTRDGRVLDKGRLRCGKCGHAFNVTCPRCSAGLTKRLHVLADFLIGAHALVQADCMLSRDLGIYKTYFGDLNLVGSA